MHFENAILSSFTKKMGDFLHAETNREIFNSAQRNKKNDSAELEALKRVL